MKIIHTADWHLGQHFMGKSREAEHQAFLDWLMHTIADRQIDALIVAGDIYDTGAPPSYARQMYNRFAVETLRAGCQLIVVAGNHDSVAMLEESSDLFNHFGICQIARPTDDPADQVVPVYSRDNRDHPSALVCAVPFVRPQHVVKSVAGQDALARQQQLQTAIASHYQSVYGAATALRDKNGWDCPMIATGHLTAVGATRSDSVRDIYIGTLEAYPADAFPPADYIALGHIHNAQKVAGSNKIRYSGSPIPLSFDESGRGTEKSVVLLNIGPATEIEAQIVPVPVYRTLKSIRGDLGAIEKQLRELSVEFASANNAESVPAVWLDIEVDTQDYLNDLQQRVSGFLTDCNAEVLLLRRSRQKHSVSLQSEQQQTLDELTVDDIFDYRLQEAFGALEQSEDPAIADTAALKARLKTMYQQVVSEVQSGEAL